MGNISRARGLAAILFAVTSVAVTTPAAAAATAPARGASNLQNVPRLKGPTPQATAPASRAAESPAAAGSRQPAQVTSFAAGLSAANDSTANGSYHTPPDSTGGIGPNHYIEMVNSTVGLFTRTLSTAPARATLLSFSQASTPGGEVRCGDPFDPQVLWDPNTSRWYFVFDFQFSTDSSCNTITDNRLYYGWTKAQNDPAGLTLGSGDWCSFAFLSGSDFPDFPKMGGDASTLIITANLYTNTFTSVTVLAIPKPFAGTISSCGSPSVTQTGTSSAHFAGNPFTLVPAQVIDGGRAYLVSVNSGNTVYSWHLDSSRVPTADGNATLGTSYSFTVPNVQQQGSSYTVDPSDTRLTQAVETTDPDAGVEAVWAQHTIADPSDSTKTAIQWFEVLPGASSSLRQQGIVRESGLFAFNAAISPTRAGNAAVLHYNTSSSSSFIDVRTRVRVGGDTLGTFGPSSTVATSTVPITDFACQSNSTPPNCRWGDYAAATPDPNDTVSVWSTTELTGTGGATSTAGWATENFVVATTPVPSAPTGVSAAPVSSTSASVSFTPGAANGATVTGYTVTSTPDGITATGSGSPITISGLTSTTSYTFTVHANTASANSPESSASNSLTPGAPGAPTGVGAAAGSQSATVNWTAPAYTGNGISGYRVTPYIGSSAQTPSTFLSTATTQTVSGLTAGTSYTFTVAALASSLAGPESAASASVIPTGPPSAPAVTVRPGDSRIFVTWAAPSDNGSAITGYTLTCTPSCGAPTTTSTSYTLSGLADGTAYSVHVAATNGSGTGPAGNSGTVVPLAAGQLATLPGGPVRIMDTRSGSSHIDNLGNYAFQTGTPRAVQITGSFSYPGGGAASIPAGITAVVMNVAVTNTAQNANLYVYPATSGSCAAPPNASSLNWPAGSTTGNLVQVPVDPTSGKVCMDTSAGPVDVIADVTGYFTDAINLHYDGLYNALSVPDRLLDTRSGSGAQQGLSTLTAGNTYPVRVVGQDHFPASGVIAAVLNITVANTSDAGFLVAYPDGAGIPNSANVNWSAGQVAGNRVTVRVGSDGYIRLFLACGGTCSTDDVIVDAVGYYTDGSLGAATPGSQFVAVSPGRLTGTPATLGDHQNVTIVSAGQSLSSGAALPGAGNARPMKALVANLAVCCSGSPGFFEAYPTPNLGTPPNSSDLNFGQGDIKPNMSIIRVGSDSNFVIFNASAGALAFVDVDGYYA